MTSSPYMDKQIMDLSSQSNNDFIDLMNPRDDRQIGSTDKKEEILPSYDFQPIRPIGSSSPPSKFETGGAGGPRAWNSTDNNSSSPSIRDYNSRASVEPAKVISEKDHNAVDSSLVSEIDRTMKKYADNLLHALDGVSARLSQLESRSRHLENSVDDLKVSVGNNYGNSDGRLRQLENILREVQNGVEVIKDKQEIMDAYLQLAKVQIPKVEQHPDTQSLEHVESVKPASSTAQQSHQQLPSGAFAQPPSTFISGNAPPPNAPPPNAPPPPPTQQNMLNMGQVPNNISQMQAPSLPQREPYFPPSGQAPENLGQPFQVPPQQLQAPSPPPPSQQYPPAPSQQYPPPPSQQYPPPQSQYSQPPAPPQPPILSNVNPPQQPPPLGHHSEEPYMQSQAYPPNVRHPPSHPSSAAPQPPSQYYGPPPPNMYEPPASRPGSGFSGAYGAALGSGEPYPYSNASQYGSSSPRKGQQLSPPAMSHGAGGGYPQLPTARPLPHALPTASGVGSGGSASGSSGNKVSIDDVVDKVTNMGFPRDHVRATVRKLTENGQAVDLNVVLDKLMNEGDGHGRAWFNR